MRADLVSSGLMVLAERFINSEREKTPLASRPTEDVNRHRDLCKPRFSTCLLKFQLYASFFNRVILRTSFLPLVRFLFSSPCHEKYAIETERAS